MSYKRNIGSNFLSQIIRIILSFTSSVIVARFLGPEGKGNISYILMIFGTIANFSHIGIINSTAFFQKKSQYKSTVILSTNLLSISFIFILITFLSIVARNKFGILTEYNNITIILGLGYVLLTQIMTLIQEFYLGNERIIEINRFLLLGELFSLVLIMLSVVFQILSLNLYVLILNTSIFIRLWLLVKNLKIKFTLNFNIKLIKEELNYGFIANIAALLIFLNYRADQFMIKIFSDITALGIYSISVTLSEFSFLIPTSISNALMGRMYNNSISEENKRIIYIRTLKVTFYASVLVSIIGIVMTSVIPYIYGNEYIDSILITRVLFLGTIFASVGKVAYVYFFTIGNTKIHFFTTLVTFLTNVLFNLTLIPRIGMLGAAVASIISYFIYGVLYIYILKKFGNFDISSIFIINKDDFYELKSMIKKFVTMFRKDTNYD